MKNLFVKLSRLIVVVVFSAIIASPSFASVYLDHSQINNYLKSLAAQYPEVSTYRQIGRSTLDRPIGMLTLTNNSTNKKEPVLLNASHHGNEKSSTFAVLGFLDYLLSDVRNNELLDHFVFYFVPVVNPDGYEMNSRFDSAGRDLNRDYTLTSNGVFNNINIKNLAPETQAMMSLLQTVKFKAAISYHSGMRGVLWPWGFTSKPNPEQGLFKRLSKKAAQALGSENYQQSYFDYPTTGEFIDFANMNYKTVALTFEVSNAYAPEDIRDLKLISMRSTLATSTVLDDLVTLKDGIHSAEFRPIFAFEERYLEKSVQLH